MEDIKKRKQKDRNVRLFPLYKGLGWDLLFYYSILYLFLTQEKGISPADVLLAESFYPIFKFAFLIPLTMLIAKIGKRKSLILANSINIIAIILVLSVENVYQLILMQFFSAIAFDIKDLSETNMLYDSLPKTKNRGKLFSKVDGKANSWSYYLDAISSVFAGFLYIINPYIPLILSLIICSISVFLSYRFSEVEEKKEAVSLKSYAKEVKVSLKYILQSDRLKYLLMFESVLIGSFAVLISLRSGVLKQIGMPDQYFGVIFAIMGIASGISARNQHRFHERFRNKTLAVLSFPTMVSCILVGLTVALKLPYTITVIVILLLYLVQYISRGPFYTLIKRYLNNFTTESLRNKIAFSYNLTENIARSLISLFASFLLKGITPAGTICIIGCVLTIIVVLLLDAMRGKVGLKPEEYKKSEIEFLEIK